MEITVLLPCFYMLALVFDRIYHLNPYCVSISVTYLLKWQEVTLPCPYRSTKFTVAEEQISQRSNQISFGPLLTCIWFVCCNRLSIQEIPDLPTTRKHMLYTVPLQQLKNFLLAKCIILLLVIDPVVRGVL